MTQWSDLEGQISNFIHNWGDGIGDGIQLAMNVSPTVQSFPLRDAEPSY